MNNKNTDDEEVLKRELKHDLTVEYEGDRDDPYGAFDLLLSVIKKHRVFPERESLMRCGCRILKMKDSYRRVIAHLWRSGVSNLSEIAKSAGINIANMSKVCSEMVKDDYIYRYENENNRRFLLFELTEKGRSLGREFDLMSHEFNTQYIHKYLTQEEIDTMCANVLEIIEILRKLDPAFSEEYQPLIPQPTE